MCFRYRKRKRGVVKTAILDEFMSLDALLDNDLEEKRKKQARERKLQKLRDECDTSLANPVFDGASPLGKLMNAMESNMSSLSADNHLFTDDLPTNQERFGYVFSPITEPLPYQRYQATPGELSSDLKLVYKAMGSADANEIGALLWSKAILLRCVLAKNDSDDASAPILFPAKIGSWLFNTSEFGTFPNVASTVILLVSLCNALLTCVLVLVVSTHSSSHVVRGCLSNLFMAIRPDHMPATVKHAYLFAPLRMCDYDH